ncbi:hypothetical protein TWF173_004603 [Orbilia oligospora]|nr:hypothetical protein TWF173_004603 [Orbilia oligospora]
MGRSTVPPWKKPLGKPCATSEVFDSGQRGIRKQKLTRDSGRHVSNLDSKRKLLNMPEAIQAQNYRPIAPARAPNSILNGLSDCEFDPDVDASVEGQSTLMGPIRHPPTNQLVQKKYFKLMGSV